MNKIILAYLLALLTFRAYSADVLNLNFPVISESPKQHLYYLSLLQRGAKDLGIKLAISFVELPQVQLRPFLERSEIDVFWMVESAERNQKFDSSPVNLTGGAIGKRVLLIRKSEQDRFESVYKLQDFATFKTAFGIEWFDHKVWMHNSLPAVALAGNWKQIFLMLERTDRDVDYFSRSVLEVLDEAAEYPKLAIEKILLFIYKRDFHLYFSPKLPDTKKKLINKILHYLQQKNMVERMAQEWWRDDFSRLNLSKRRIIKMETPGF